MKFCKDIEKSINEPASGVMKVNGGANAGHTAAGLKLNLLPSGVGDPKVEDLIVSAGVVADPRKFLWEALALERRGLTVLSRLKIDENVKSAIYPTDFLTWRGKITASNNW